MFLGETIRFFFVSNKNTLIWPKRPFLQYSTLRLQNYRHLIYVYPPYYKIIQFIMRSSKFASVFCRSRNISNPTTPRRSIYFLSNKFTGTIRLCRRTCRLNNPKTHLHNTYYQNPMSKGESFQIRVSYEEAKIMLLIFHSPVSIISL